ncbi:SLC13 family permease [Aeromonas hydrophila]|uniref:SLC13 family permease n=1 Tax=Aeromonas hydrophila TaxID=644 RepID=UPI0030D1D5BC
MDINVLILGALILSIVIGFITNINIGILSIVFSYILSYSYGLTANDILSLWPMKLFFILLSITYFYGYAITNGTLTIISERIVHAVKKESMIPIALFALVVIFAGIGPGHYAAFAFMSPLIMSIAEKIKMNKILAAIIIYSGACVGSFNPFSLGGRVTEQLIISTGLVESSFKITSHVFYNMAIVHVGLFVICYFLFKGYKVSSIENHEHQLLNKKQKQTVILIFSVFALVIIPSLLYSLFPEVKELNAVSKIMEPTLLSFIGICIANLLNLSDHNKVIKNIPWNIIFMICGLGMLISLSAEVGVIDQIAIWIKGTASPTLLPYLVAGSSAFMSLFSSSMGVVMPTMYPIVPKIAAVGSEDLLFSLIAIFATLTGYSPVSSGGALVLAGVTDEEERRALFVKLIILPFAAFGVACLLIMFNAFIY